MKIQKSLIVGGLLLCGLGLPRASFAISGCSNGYLMGTYNAQVSSMNFSQALQGNTTATSTTTTGTTTTGSGTTATSTPPVGFGNSPASLSGSVPGLGRFFFDGNGAIVGLAGGVNTVVGTYSVNQDCTVKVSLGSGSTFDGVLVNGGSKVLFIETDSAGSGSVGTLQRASSCVDLSYRSSFGFSFSGATRQTSTTNTGTTTGTGTGTGTTGTGTGTTTGTGSTPTATTTTQFAPYSAVGAISLDGNGNFTLTQTSFVNGGVQRSTGFGTYAAGADCSIKLNFGGITNADGTAGTIPVSLRGLLSDGTGGTLSLQPNQTDALTGLFVVQ
jgi:hypothetical protein